MIDADHEVYFDDSGTDGRSPIAVAACYIAKKTQWDEFVRNWNDILSSEEFSYFHMVEFIAKPEDGYKPFCSWDNEKKDRVYRKLAATINLRVRKGFVIAVPKESFDRLAREDFKREYSRDHYSWAVATMLSYIAEWRKRYDIITPMQYVFDHGTLAEPQIADFWSKEQLEKYRAAGKKFGIVRDGVMFEDKKAFKPLQAADILAWQARNHLRLAHEKKLDDPNKLAWHRGFAALKNVDTMYFTEQLMQKHLETMNAHKDKTGKWPWDDLIPPENVNEESVRT